MDMIRHEYIGEYREIMLGLCSNNTLNEYQAKFFASKERFSTNCAECEEMSMTRFIPEFSRLELDELRHYCKF